MREAAARAQDAPAPGWLGSARRRLAPADGAEPAAAGPTGRKQGATAPSGRYNPVTHAWVEPPASGGTGGELYSTTHDTAVLRGRAAGSVGKAAIVPPTTGRYDPLKHPWVELPADARFIDRQSNPNSEHGLLTIWKTAAPRR